MKSCEKCQTTNGYFLYTQKKKLHSGTSFKRAMDGARTRGLDLGKVARYQLRHHRIYLSLSLSLCRRQ